MLVKNRDGSREYRKSRGEFRCLWACPDTRAIPQGGAFVDGLKELDAAFDHILMEIQDPGCPPAQNPFEQPEKEQKTVRFRSVVPITVRVSEDGLSASVFVCETGNESRYTVEELRAAVEAKGVKACIDEAVLESMAEEQIYNTEIVFARGILPVDGTDGSVSETAQPDTDIAKGEEICRLIPASEGKDGLDVFGNTLPAANGQTPALFEGQNTRLSEDGTVLTAAVSGRLVHRDGVFSVINEYVVRGDVKRDNNQISFAGDITIYGNVSEGANITAGGSVYIHGSVIGAEITARQISIEYIVRHSSIVSRGGNIKLMNCVDSKIECDGNLSASVLLNCEVFCTGEIVCLSSQGSICGGTVSSVKRITCLIAGNHMHETTRLLLGHCSEYCREQEELKRQISVIDADIERLDKRSEMLKARKDETGKITIEDEDFLEAAARIRLQKNEEREPLAARLAYVEGIVGSAGSAELRVMRALYPGVSLAIGEKYCNIDVEYGKVLVYAGDLGIVFS